MLNLIRSSKLEFRQSCIEILMALCMGVFMVAALIFLDETDAQTKLAQHIFNLAHLESSQQQETVSDAEVGHSQLELTRLKSRVLYLTRRQEEREDLNDVQAILLSQSWGQKGKVGDLNSLQWQHGKLEFEVLTKASEDWQNLLSDMNLFDRWQTAPQIFHAHRSLTKPSTGGAGLVEVKLKANQWARASNSLAAKTAP